MSEADEASITRLHSLGAQLQTYVDSNRGARTLRANDDETNAPLEFTLEGRGHILPWSCRASPSKRTLADGSATEGGRRPTVVSAPSAASPELSDRPRRRTFTAAYKLGILRQVDEAGPGGIGAILRREGLYSSLLTDWRRQRDAGVSEALKAVKRGPKVAEPNPLAAEHAQLQRDYKSLTLRLQRAEAIVEIQKKVALLLGLSMPGDEAS